MSTWKVNAAKLPGPDRRKRQGLRDILQVSPEGGYLAVVYSCGEVGIMKEVGSLALFSGPPEAPRLLLCPRYLRCLVRYDDRTVQWIGERFCVVEPYHVRQNLSGGTRSFGGALYLDAEQHRVAHVPGEYPGSAASGLPQGLAWKDWKWLSFWPWLWYRRSTSR